MAANKVNRAGTAASKANRVAMASRAEASTRTLGTTRASSNGPRRMAANHGGADSGMFSQAINYAKSNTSQHTQPIDENDVTDAHQQAYGQGNASNLSASSMGSAAAMQALKHFTSGGSSGGASGGGGQSALIAMAMSEAGKLFDQSGGAASGSKQDAISGAAMTVMKMMTQSGGSSSSGGGMLSMAEGMIGGGSSGGLGPMQMMSLAKNFM
ncbi:hypothetical protein HWV62_42554 [Athelia sp. TMB]|nr:hypothetical protein HWV62_42554 [Athelia sp. TMB]